jgi:hypothetical protein
MTNFESLLGEIGGMKMRSRFLLLLRRARSWSMDFVGHPDRCDCNGLQKEAAINRNYH